MQETFPPPLEEWEASIDRVRHSGLSEPTQRGRRKPAGAGKETQAES